MTEVQGEPGASTPPPVQEAEPGGPGTALGTTAVSINGPDGERASTLSLSGWTVARGTLVMIAALGGFYLLWRIQEVLLLLLLAILFATAIEPLVNHLRRGPFSRGQGILIVYSGLFLLLAALGMFLVPNLLGQLTQFVDTLPQRVAALQVILNHTLRPAVEEPTPRVPVPEAELAGDERPDPGTLAARAR